MTEQADNPKLKDPNHVMETYADNLVVAQVKNGLVFLTFTVTQTTKPVTIKDRTVLTEDVVCARLILAPDAAGPLLDFLEKTVRLKAEAPIAREQKPN